jgi:integrase/recombinase XerD
MAAPQTERSRTLLGPCDPDSIAAWIRRYLEALAVQHHGKMSRDAKRSNLAWFNHWCIERGLSAPRQITHAHVVKFQQHLFHARKRNGEPYAINGQRSILDNVLAWCRWMVRHGHLPSNPAADLDLPRTRAYHLREPLNVSEVEAVLAQPDIEDMYGLRDRAILELFYATGIRRQELSNLELRDIDEERGCVFVRQGKGRKDRFVPIGERALAWVRKYEHESRPLLLLVDGMGHTNVKADPKEPRLFLNQYGLPLSPYALSWRIRRYFDAAGVKKAGACHLFRHTVATSMLDNGAELRHVQEMLGHSIIVTTQRYTHVSIARLRAVHAATHPGATLTRRAEAEDGD